MHERRNNSSPNRRTSFRRLELLRAAAAAPIPAARGAEHRIDGEFWNKQYTAKKGAVNLALYRRRLKAPDARREAACPWC